VPREAKPALREEDEMAESLTDKAQERGQRVRVNANFSPESYEVLTEIAERRGKSISDVLRDAIAFEKWYQDIVDSGGHVLVERDIERLREIVRP
jgi:Ribbon-helix-helix protein, copG family